MLTLFDDNTVKPKSVGIYKPELITKALKLSTLPNGLRRIRLSTNFLPLMGFNAGIRTQVHDLGVNQGLEVKFDPKGSSKVYTRSYTQRKNNPLETQLDIQNQTLIERAFPSDADRLHFLMREGSIIIKPLFNSTFSIRKKLKQAENKFSSFVALTGGVDMACIQEAGFSVTSMLEYRPQEKRDKQDLTETGALNAITNTKVKNLFNEDLATINWGMVSSLLEQEEQIALLHLSIPCQDHSNAKSESLKQKAIETLDTTIDLVYDSLRLIETTKPATILIENVPNFGKSHAADLVRLKLRRWGYYINEAILDAREHGGLSSRKRYYLVASVWPGFEMPGSQPSRTDLWNLIENHLPECRDVSETGALYKGIEVGRSRIISKDSTFSPTIMKSQNRQGKDAVYIKHQDKYYFPSENLIKAINGIPDRFNLENVSSTIASEIIGQSIDYPMHQELVIAIREHINTNA